MTEHQQTQMARLLHALINREGGEVTIAGADLPHVPMILAIPADDGVGFHLQTFTDFGAFRAAQVKANEMISEMRRRRAQ